MITDYMRQLAYNEGCQAYADNVLCMDNPYEGNSDELYYMWDDGWWFMFYEEIGGCDEHPFL